MLRSVGYLVALPLAYAAAVLIGRASRLNGGEVALVWPAAAVGVIWLLSAWRLRPAERAAHLTALVLTAFVTNIATGASVQLSVWFVLVNVVLSVVTVELLTYRRRDVAFRDPTDLVRLIAAVAAGTCISAALATAFFAIELNAPAWETFELFAVRNGATTLLGVSIWLSLRERPLGHPQLTAASVIEALAVAGVLAAIFYFTFWVNSGLPMAFLTLVPTMWVALRYSTTVSTIFLTVAGIWIVWATLSDTGVFVGPDVQVRALLAQAMVGSLSLVVVTLSLYRDSRTRLITQLEQARDRADHLASHDPLTGLANRALFTASVESALLARPPRSERVGLIFLDLDDFKAVNDTWGHAGGDDVLIEVSERITSAIRPTDIAARLGGDEFAVLCPDADDIDGLHAMAERLAAEVRRPIRLSTGDVYDRPSVSAGVVMSTQGCSAERLLHRADALMYDAKRSGKDCVIVEPVPALHRIVGMHNTEADTDGHAGC